MPRAKRLPLGPWVEGRTWFGARGAGDVMALVRWFSHVPSLRMETFAFHAWGAGWSFLLELNQKISFIWYPYKTIEDKRTSEKNPWETVGNGTLRDLCSLTHLPVSASV